MIFLYLVICTVSAGFFAGLETGLLSANRMLIQEKKRRGVFKARCAEYLLVKPERLLATTLVGTNIANVTAAVLCAQIRRRVEILARREEIYAQYSRELEGMPGVVTQPVAPWAKLSPWLYSVLLENRERVAARLTACGVETRPFFIPMHQLPEFAECTRSSMSVTEDLAQRGLNLPTYPDMTGMNVEHVIRAVRQAFDA